MRMVARQAMAGSAKEPGKALGSTTGDLVFTPVTPCRVVDTRGVNKYNWFVLEVTHAWVDPRVKTPRTLHHRGHGRFMRAGDEFLLPSRMK